MPLDRAVDPNQMYLVAWGAVFSNVGWAVAATALFVFVSQLKINVTNAYAGSLAWSNFFARLTHSHPGRVVWMVFNILIALMLMELNVFQALGKVLGLYSNIAISWMTAVVADLVINKPLGWSPKGIEFKRAHLYDVNPVGVGAMGVASVVSIAAYHGALGEMAQAFSALIALVTALVVSPLLAWATRGRYYLAREPAPEPAPPDGAAGQLPAPDRLRDLRTRVREPTTWRIARPTGAASARCAARSMRAATTCASRTHGLRCSGARPLRRLVPQRVWQRLDTELGHYLMLMLLMVPMLCGLFIAVYQHQRRALAAGGPLAAHAESALQIGFVKLFAALLVISAVVAWWLVLKHRSAQVAQEESNRQTHLLVNEIESHRLTDDALQDAKQQAELANAAKSRYISTISHELRTPLNSIIGYAQLLDEDAGIPPHRRQAVSVIRRGGEHLLSLIEGTLDLARIESGKLSLDVRPMQLRESMLQIAHLFELQAAAKGISFAHRFDPQLPELVRCDEKRLRQILINVLGNAVKFTQAGGVVFRVRHVREMAIFEIEDTGPASRPTRWRGSSSRSRAAPPPARPAAAVRPAAPASASRSARCSPT